MEKLPVYEGQQPYLFISYAHANAPAVMQAAEELAAQGYRIWYDEGIEVGSEWPEYIASHLASSSLMIAFLSNAYMRSDNCRREMHFALTRKIPVINVFLEETAMTPGMEMQIGNLFALMKYRMDDGEFYDKLLAAPQLDPSLRGTEAAPKRRRRRKKAVVDLGVEARRKKRRKIRRFVAAGLVLALLIAALVLGLVGWSTGLLPRLMLRREQTEHAPPDGTERAVFSCPALEEAARSHCGLAEGELHVSDLTALTELSLSGGEITQQALAELRYFPDLRSLTLEDAPVADLSALPVCAVETLTLRRCALTSLSGVGALPYLRELCVEDCPLRDLGDLGSCLELRRLAVRGGFVRNYASLRALIRLTEVELSGLTLQQLKPILRKSALSDLTLRDCDLRGRFFRSFDRESALIRLSLTDCKLSSTRNLDDFRSLAELTLIRSGQDLDFSALSSLPRLRSVRVSGDMAETMRRSLVDSEAVLEIEPDPDAGA